MTDKTIWENGSFHQDGWQYLAGSETRSGDLIISLADWQSGNWSSHAGRLGLDIHAGDDIEAVAADLENFDIVVVNFPAFGDGRAFSIARLIRDKYAFDGEIRAKGAYILDQMPMLVRCGVTTFDISSDAVRTGLNRGVWPDMSLYYQKALDGQGNEARTRGVDVKRPWLTVNVAVEDVVHLSAA